MTEFSHNLRKTLHRALDLASARNHKRSGLEHLLLSLTKDYDALQLMFADSVNVYSVRNSLIKYLDSEFENLEIEASAGNKIEPKPTTSFQRVIQRSVIHVQSSGRETVTGANVVVAIFAERESKATHVLQEQDFTRYDAVNYLSHGIAKDRDFMPKFRQYLNKNNILNIEEDVIKQVSLSKIDGRKSKNIRKKLTDRDIAIRHIRKSIKTKIVVGSELTLSMTRLAQLELAELERYRPNSLEAQNQRDAQIELMNIFIDGFNAIYHSLQNSESENKSSINDATKSVISLADAVNKWWSEQNQKVIHLAIGTPVIAGAAGTMKILGADPYCQVLVTGAAASAWLGGDVVKSAINIAKEYKSIK